MRDMKHRFFKRAAALGFVLAFAVSLLAPLANAATAQAGAAPAHNARAPKAKHDVLHLKVADGVTLMNGHFSGEPADQVSQLDALLANAGRIKAEKLRNRHDDTQLQQQMGKDLDRYYRVTLSHDVDMPSLTAELQALPVVEAAYAEPNPAPVPTASYVTLQNYLQAAPSGIDANYARTFPGGTGGAVKVFDLEYSWNTDHEDLTKARTATLAFGTPADPFDDNNHGTAVIGEMVADSNGYGVTGAVPDATLVLVNVYASDRGYDPAGALHLVASRAAPGDVVIVEQQTWGPTSETYDFVPIEWIPEVYDAIRTLTANGITVVEPAGNGAQNLDDASYYGSTFPMDKPDSGAIIVGAAYNCSNQTRLARMSFSDYGRRVNVQGPGECVTTTGYGDLNNAGANAYYTAYFSGTSSATPVIAAAAASVSSAYKTLNGVNMTPLQVRQALLANGVAQNTDGGTITGNIGPYPNLAKALLTTDISAPAIPRNVKAAAVTGSKPSVRVTWSTSTDNVKVSSYRLYRNGALYKSLSTATYTDASVSKGKTYNYSVVAVDSSGNASARSAVAWVKL
jgi:serine protease